MRGEGFVFFKGEMIEIRELIGIDEDFVFFNPNDEGFLIQSSDLVYIRSGDEFYNIKEIDEPFEIVYKGKVIATSENLNPEVIQSILDDWEKRFKNGDLLNGKTINRKNVN